MTDLWEAIARPRVANMCVVASASGVPIEQWVPDARNLGGSGVVSSKHGPVIVYRGFGSWGEAKDSLAAGRWLSKGMFTVRGEGETQMALDLQNVLDSSRKHQMRGTGFLGYIEADVAGLPFRTFINEGENLVLDGTSGVLRPDTGLGIGIDGGIPLDRIRKVVALDEDGTQTVMSMQELRNSLEMKLLKERKGWTPQVTDRPETHQFVIIYGPKLKGKYHKANNKQNGPLCETSIDWSFSKALVIQVDLMNGWSVIRDQWSGQLFDLPGKPCPLCFEWTKTKRAAAVRPMSAGITYKLVDGNPQSTSGVYAMVDPAFRETLSPYMRRNVYFDTNRNGEPYVGRMILLYSGHAQGDPRPLHQILLVEVHERFQHQGIATKMYMMAKEWADRHGYRLVHCDLISPEAKAWIATLPGEQWGLDKGTKQDQLNSNTFWTSEWSLKRL